jgi:aminopeptidase N
VGTVSIAAFMAVSIVGATALAADEGDVCGHGHHAFGAPADGHPVPAPAQRRKYAPDRQADIQHMKLDVTPDFEKHTVSGTATIAFTPIARPLKSLELDALELKVSKVRSSHEVRDYSSDGKKLTIVFKEPIPVDAKAHVEIDYSAEPVEGLYFRTADMGFPKGDTHCWTQGEPHEARHWFPCFDHPNERASSEIICHVPRDMTVVSNGRLMEEKDEDNDMKAVHWLQEKPHATYLICMAAGHFAKLEAKHGDTPLGFYTQPSKAKYAENPFRDTPDIMDFFEHEIGVPFPWEKYDQVTCADYHWGGMENTTLTTLTQRAVFSDDVENTRSSRSLVAHEMAHQWFGDYVTCKDWSQLWLNESFATYYALLYEGHKFGRDAMQYEQYLDAQNEIFPFAADKRPIVYRNYTEPGEQFDFRNYPKGSWVLHMLRSLVGEDLYRQAIHTYLKRHALGNVESEDLRKVFEELSGRPLDKFFDQWVYHGGMPELKVSYEWLAEEKLAKVTVEQTQKTDDDVLMFQLETKLRFVVDGKNIDEPVKIDGQRHEFFVKLPAEPTVVRFDPDYTLLAKVDFDKSEKLLLAQLKNEKDAIGRVLACDELASRDSQDAVKALAHAVKSDPFFGVRIQAAIALRKIGTDEAVAALLDSLEQADARVRLRVVEQIGKCHREAARDKLLEVFKQEKNPAVVAAAIRGLGLYQGEEVAKVIREALGRQSFMNDETGAAFRAAADLKDAKLAPELMKTIKAREEDLDPRDVGDGMASLAKLSQRGKRQQAAYEFLAAYLHHPRRFLQGAAVRALGELHDPAARERLEALAADERNEGLKAAAKGALEELDKKPRLAPAEVIELRQEVRELRESQKKLEKSLEELKSKKSATKGERKSA